MLRLARSLASPLRTRALAASLLAALVLAGAMGAGRALAATGEAGFVFLKIGVGARAMGMGSAYVAVADDPTALHWNPAGLASSREGIRLTAMHNEWIDDFRQEYVAVSGPVGPGTAGASFTGFYTSELERRDETGTLTGHFGYNDIAATIGYGLRVAPGADAGLAIRYIREMIADENASTVAFDLGGKFAVRKTGLVFGAAVQNVGGEASFDQESFPIPLTIRGGASYRRAIASIQGSALLTTEYRKARGEDGRFHLGGEYSYRDWLSFRAGAKFGYDEENVSFGLGVARGPIHFDYALLPVSSNLGSSHLFSLSAKL